MVIKNGSSTVTKPPNIYGNNKELKQGDNHRIIAEYNFGNKNTIIPLYGHLKTTTGEESSTQSEPANFSYELKDNLLGAQYFFAHKMNNFYAGFGSGYQDVLYAFIDFGVNKKYFEVGTAILAGYSSNTLKYDGYSVDEKDSIIDTFNDSKNDGNLYLGAYLHSSIFLKPFALNYSVSISRARSDVVYESDGCDAFLEFDCTRVTYDFPALIMQDIGIAYSNKYIGYRVSLNNTIDSDLKKSYYGTSFQVALFL